MTDNGIEGPTEFQAVFAATAKMFRGGVVHARNVTAGNGILVDWRRMKSGDLIMTGADHLDVARHLVHLVGASAVIEACDGGDE